MNYLSPINACIEPIREEAQNAISLYDIDFNFITGRTIWCRYCSEIRKIAEFKRLCDECDRTALKSSTDHEYECPFGLMEAVVHIPLKNGMMHAIIGKRRSKSGEYAMAKLLKVKTKKPIDLDLMMKAYMDIPLSGQDDFEKHIRALRAALLDLRDKGRLKSFESETVLQTIRVMKERGLMRCLELYPLLYRSIPSINKIYWEVCGEPFCDFVRGRKMTLAEDRLTNSDDSIKEIAKNLGYNYMYFQTLFKRLCTVTPAEFRKTGFHGAFHPLYLPF